MATKKAPPVTLPLRFMVTGIASYLLLHFVLAVRGLAIFGGDYLSATTLGIVHLATLGWVSMVMMGAIYQLVPVLLQLEIYSEALGRAGYWPTLAGVAGMIAGFWTINPGLVAAAGLVTVIGSYVFVLNMFLTLRRVRGWSVQAWAILGSVSFFFLTVSWGLLLALNLRYGFLGAGFEPQMAAHAAFGLAGWFSLTIFAVGYRLVPMFALSHGFSERRHGIAALLLAVGTAAGGLVGATGLGRGMLPFIGAMILAAFVVFVFDIREIVMHRRRRRMELVTWFSLVAIGFGILASLLVWLALLGFRPSWLGPGAWLTGIVYTALMGWISLMMVGQLYKIIPFLIWLHRYSERAGREAVPLVRDLYSAEAGLWSFRLLLAGTVGTDLAILAGQPALAAAAAAVALAGAVIFGYAMLQVLLGLRYIPRRTGDVEG